MRDILARVMGGKPRSAAAVVDRLVRKGIARGEICGTHLASVYAGLRRLDSAPDFQSVKGMVAARPSRNVPIESQVLGVMVETRQHKDLAYVVQTFSAGLQIPIQLFHGRKNLEYIMSGAIAPLVEEGGVHLVQLETDALNASQYNALLLSGEFWESMISTEKILIFQTDAIICKDSDYGLNDFLSFDYIGSKWKRQRPVGLMIDGGNGGLSLRDWRMSRECLRRFPPAAWTGGEDGYFAFHMDVIGGNVGRAEDCARFSTQEEFLQRSFGAHKISCLNANERIAFLKYCEQGKFMLR